MFAQTVYVTYHNTTNILLCAPKVRYIGRKMRRNTGHYLCNIQHTKLYRHRYPSKHVYTYNKGFLRVLYIRYSMFIEIHFCLFSYLLCNGIFKYKKNLCLTHTQTEKFDAHFTTGCLTSNNYTRRNSKATTQYQKPWIEPAR